VANSLFRLKTFRQNGLRLGKKASLPLRHFAGKRAKRRRPTDKENTFSNPG
jgi:hypothetical protein